MKSRSNANQSIETLKSNGFEGDTQGKKNMGDSPMSNAIIISLPTPNTLNLKKLTEISRGLIFKISFSLFLLRHFKRFLLARHDSIDLGPQFTKKGLNSARSARLQ